MIDLLSKKDMCDDLAWNWVLTLFGYDDSGCTSQLGLAVANTPYAAAFQVFTTALTFIGGLLLAYHVISGVVHSAYTGKVLGERWHQIWAPLRVVLGFGLIIPVGNGFSTVHYVLRDVVAVGAINLANGIIVTYMDQTINPKSEYNNAILGTLSGKDIAEKFFTAEVCNGVVSTMGDRGFLSKSYLTASPEKPDETGIFTSTGLTWNYFACGSVTLYNIEQDSKSGVMSVPQFADMLNSFNIARQNATKELQAEIRGMTDYRAIGKWIDQHGDSIQDASSSVLSSLRENSVIDPGMNAKLQAATKKWNNKITDAANKIFVDYITNMKAETPKMVKKYGFMAAGSFERSLSTISGFISGIANQGVEASVPNVDEDTFAKINFALNSYTLSNGIDNLDATGADSISDTIGKLLEGLFPDMMNLTPNVVLMKEGKVSTDPVGDMIIFGNTLLTTATYAIGLYIAIQAGTFIVGVISAVSAVATLGASAPAGVTATVLAALGKEAVAAAMPWVAPVVLAMILVGLTYTFVLPMIPMIMVFIMALSWLIMFLEGSIAAVLWAFVFIRMDGHEFLDQKQSPGMSLLFNLLLRPALGMLAFCGMLILVPTVLNALSQIWYVSFHLQTGSHSWKSLVWVYQWAAEILIYCWLQWTLYMRIASLVPSIADRVGGWMGMHGGQGYNEGGETAAAVGAALTASKAMDGIIKGGVNAQNKGRDESMANIRMAADAKRAAKMAASTGGGA